MFLAFLTYRGLESSYNSSTTLENVVRGARWDQLLQPQLPFGCTRTKHACLMNITSCKIETFTSVPTLVCTVHLAAAKYQESSKPAQSQLWGQQVTPVKSQEMHSGHPVGLVLQTRPYSKKFQRKLTTLMSRNLEAVLLYMCHGAIWG